MVMHRHYRWLRYQWAYYSRYPFFLIITLLILLAVAGGGFFTYEKYGIPPATTHRASATQPPHDAKWICQHAAEAAQPSVAENSCPGTAAWQIDHAIGEQHAIEGFTVPVSVNIGDQVKLYVSTTAASYQFQIYR